MKEMSVEDYTLRILKALYRNLSRDSPWLLHFVAVTRRKSLKANLDLFP